MKVNSNEATERFSRVSVWAVQVNMIPIVHTAQVRAQVHPACEVR